MSFSPSNAEISSLLVKLEATNALPEDELRLLKRAYVELRAWRNFALNPMAFYPPSEQLEPFELNLYLMREQIIAAPKFVPFTHEISNQLSDGGSYAVMLSSGECVIYTFSTSICYDQWSDEIDEVEEFEDGIGFVDAEGDALDTVYQLMDNFERECSVKGILLLNLSSDSQFMLDASESIPGVRNRNGRLPPIAD